MNKITQMSFTWSRINKLRVPPNPYQDHAVLQSSVPTLNETKQPAFDLLMSVFITHKRLHGYPNTFNRLDIFKYTLESYSRINWRSVYLLVELDDEFQPRRSELLDYINSLFKNAYVEFKRIGTKNEWASFFNTHYTNSTEDPLICFMQNDDHVFIDFKLDILEEGIQLIHTDPVPYKCLAISHWPEALRLSGKFNNHEQVGNYVKFKWRTTEPMVCYNLRYLKHFLLDVPWPSEILYRTDNLPVNVDLTVYVPFRELCRHFDGYTHVGIYDECPALKLPKELNDFRLTTDQLKRRIHVPHGGAMIGNQFVIPVEWEQRIIDLYRPILADKKTFYKHVVLITDPTNHIGEEGIVWHSDPNVFAMNKEIWKQYMNVSPDTLALFLQSDKSLNPGEHRLDMSTQTLVVSGIHSYGKSSSAMKLTILAFKVLKNYFDFDYSIRSTSSCFWVLPKLQGALEGYSNDKFAGGTRSFQHLTYNPSAPHLSGCAWILSKDIVDLMIENQPYLESQEEYDDLVIAKFLTDNHIELVDMSFYNFEHCPENINDIIKYTDVNNVLFYRIKTHNRLVSDTQIMNDLLNYYYK
jgi:hypothetical protein